jgi:hypothetical protein
MQKVWHPTPEWIRSYPIRHRSVCILPGSGSDPIRSYTGAHTPSSGMDPTRSDPVPGILHIIPEWFRCYPILCRSLYIISRRGSDPTRPDAEACTSSPGVDPIRSDPTPKLEPILPEWIRPDPSRYRSSYILFRDGPDHLRPDTGAYTLFPRCNRSHPIRYPSLWIGFRNGPDHIRPDTELIHYRSAWIRSYPIRYQSCCVFLPGWIRSDPIRSYPIQ